MVDRTKAENRAPHQRTKCSLPRPPAGFWRIVEASSVEDVATLWRDFDRRASELRAIAKREDIADSLWHLGRALDANELFSEWGLRAKRASILKGIRAAGK
jgi:hypothetical protein